MGNEASQAPTRLDYKPLVVDSNITPTTLKARATKEKKPIRLLKTQYHGVWTMLFPNGLAPMARIGHSYVFDKRTNTVIIAYGQGEDGEYYNDCWEYNVIRNQWNRIRVSLLSPRSYASATLVGDQMFIFGGENKVEFYSDLHSINIKTHEVNIIELPGSNPSPRSSPVLLGYENQLILWSGSDHGRPHKAIHILRPDSSEWLHIDTMQTGRAAPAYCEHKGKHYVFGSTKGTGLLVYDPEHQTFEPVVCSGAEPPHEIEHAALCGVDEFLFLVGGQGDVPNMHIFTLDLNRRWWFAFHIRPDMETLSLDDGIVNKNGLFMLPREHSESLVYCEENRTLYSVLGSRMGAPPPVFEISIGTALGSLHMRNDMFECLHQALPQTETESF